MKNSEQHVNYGGKKIKMIFIFTTQASNRLTNRLTRERNVSFIILELDNSITLPFGRLEQTTKKASTKYTKRFVARPFRR